MVHYDGFQRPSQIIIGPPQELGEKGAYKNRVSQINSYFSSSEDFFLVHPQELDGKQASLLEIEATPRKIEERR
jgi:hypothetical protein